MHNSYLTRSRGAGKLVYSLTASAVLLALASCAQVNAIVLQKPDATRLTGDWEGTYTCGPKPTGVNLSMAGTETGQVTATLDFHGTPDDPQLPSGRYTMRGTFAPDGTLNLRPDSWVNRPGNARMVSLAGRVDILTIGFEGTVPECHRPFRVTKASSGAPPVAQPAAAPSPSGVAPVATQGPSSVVGATPAASTAGPSSPHGSPQPASVAQVPATPSPAPATSGKKKRKGLEAQAPQASAAATQPTAPIEPWRSEKLVFDTGITAVDLWNADIPSVGQDEVASEEGVGMDTTGLAKLDLNGDGALDYLVTTAYSDQHGCDSPTTAKVLLSTRDGHAVALERPVVDALEVASTSSNGVRDLVTRAYSGPNLRLAFEGGRYRVAELEVPGRSNTKKRYGVKEVDDELSAKPSTVLLEGPSTSLRTQQSVPDSGCEWMELLGQDFYYVLCTSLCGAELSGGFVGKNSVVVKQKGAAPTSSPAASPTARKAAPSKAPGLCKSGEDEVFSCKTRAPAKVASVCKVGDDLAFRFGKPGAPEISSAVGPIPTNRPFKLRVDGGLDTGTKVISFVRGDVLYLVNDGGGALASFAVTREPGVPNSKKNVNKACVPLRSRWELLAAAAPQ